MKKALKVSLIVVVSSIMLVVCIAGGYVAYVSAQYYRIEDLFAIDTEGNKNTTMNISGEYSVITYNIGFGAYNHNFSFFMDSGEMLDGTIVNGTMSKAESKNVVLTNTNGVITSMSSYNADFYLFQEVDKQSTRSYKVNQYEMLKAMGDEYSYTYGINFHSAFLAYPLNDFHGKVLSGITTLSKYKIDSTTRRSFPVDNSFPNKFFDLDRCFILSRIPLSNGKELVLINLHMSAYDKGGTIRALQLAMLNAVLREEYDKGNYVIAGGDFNHDIADSLNLFATEQKVPEWVFVLTDNDLTENFSFAAAVNAPTCRSTDMPYVKGSNYTVVIDGFIVSDNVNATFIENIDLDFEFSDHNPVRLTFSFIE